MASDSVVRARIDSDTKRDATAALESMGLSISDAIRLLLVRVAEERRLPFEIRVPNAASKAAMNELDRGGVKGFDTIDELLDDMGR